MARCAHAPWPPNTIPSRGRVYYVSHDWRIRILHAMLPSEGCVLFLCSSMACLSGSQMAILRGSIKVMGYCKDEQAAWRE